MDFSFRGLYLAHFSTSCFNLRPFVQARRKARPSKPTAEDPLHLRRPDEYYFDKARRLQPRRPLVTDRQNSIRSNRTPAGERNSRGVSLLSLLKST